MNWKGRKLNNIINNLLIRFRLIRKKVPVITENRYVPFLKLSKMEQFKINHELSITQDTIRRAHKQRNLDKVRSTLLNGLEKGFRYDVRNFVAKHNVMPDPQLMLDNYATIPGFVSVFSNAGITSDTMLQLLKKLTGNINAKI